MTAATLTATEIREALGARRGSKLVRCPAHDDRNPSLSVDDGREGVVVKCFAGCTQEAVIAALRERGLWPERTASSTWRDPIDDIIAPSEPPREVARYRYVDEAGARLFDVVRLIPKDFRQRLPDQLDGGIGTTRRVLYRLPELLAAVMRGETVYIAEGERDVHSLEAAGVVATTSPGGAGKWRPEYGEALRGAHVRIIRDRDEPGRKHAAQVAASLEGIAASIAVLEAASGKDASDHLAAGLALADLVPVDASHPAERRSLAEAEAVFQRWLGEKYDLDALRFVLATAAAERLDGDPLWALIISGSGAAKTETVGALSASGAIITSTITSEGALLSASSRREVAKDATGGLLRRLGSSGVLVIKDVTSVLSMNRDARAAVLAALREVHDGRWERNVGVDGGKTLTWEGRVAIIGAVTTAWDRAHDVIASMGDRFVTLRIDSTIERMAAGRRAIANTGVEVQMREELAAAVAGVLAGIQQTPAELTEDEQEHVLAAADLVTTARTGVDYDYRGDVIDANAPEMPTRFAKQLAQVMRGGLAIGMTREDALRLAIRCARDSMPPLRLEILEDVGANPEANTTDVRKRLGKPRTTVDRQLQSLQMLGLLDVTELEGVGVAGRSVWYWRLAEGVDTSVLASPEKSPTVCRVKEEDSSERDAPHTNKSGDGRCPRCGGPIYANRKPLECFATGCGWRADDVPTS